MDSRSATRRRPLSPGPAAGSGRGPEGVAHGAGVVVIPMAAGTRTFAEMTADDDGASRTRRRLPLARNQLPRVLNADAFCTGLWERSSQRVAAWLAAMSLEPEGGQSMGLGDIARPAHEVGVPRVASRPFPAGGAPSSPSRLGWPRTTPWRVSSGPASSIGRLSNTTT